MSGLDAGVVTDALSPALPHEPLDAEVVRAGAPSTGIRELGAFRDVELGIWEMSEGAAVDTETDEVFIVWPAPHASSSSNPCCPRSRCGQVPSCD